MGLRLERDELVVNRSLDRVVTNNPASTQLHEDTNQYGAASRVGHLNQQAAFLKLGITNKVPQAPAPQPVSPGDVLNQINALPVPKYSDTPHNLPPEDRQAILDGRLEDYNNRRAAIANDAIRNSKPPSRDDYKGLPPATANAEYQEALRNYQSQLAALKKVSREAKQANLEMTPEFKSLSPENQELVRAQLAKVEGNPGDVDTLIGMVKSEGFTKLTPDEQRQMLQIVGGNDKAVSGPARQKLAGLLNDPKVNKADPETFRKFLIEQPASNIPYFDIDKQSSDLIEKYTSHGFWGADLDTDGLGKEVAELAKTEPDKAAALMDDILKKIVGSDKDEVAQTFVESMSPEELRAFASSDKGREVLGQLKDQLLSGNVFPDEKEAAARIDSAIKAADLEKSPEFRRLSPEAQQATLDLIAKHDKNARAVDNIIALVKSNGFDGLPVATQKLLLDALGKRPTDGIFREALTNLIQNGRFTALSSGQQARVLNDLVKFASTESYSKFITTPGGFRRGGTRTDRVTDDERRYMLSLIGGASIYSEEHPGLTSVRNAIDKVTSGQIRMEAYFDDQGGRNVNGTAADGEIRMNRFANQNRPIEQQIDTFVHEVNHIVNGKTDAENKEPVIMDKLRQLRIGTWTSTGTDSLPVYHSSAINPDYSFSIKGLGAGPALLSLDGSEEGFSLARIQYPNATPADRIPVNADEQITGVRLFVRFGTATINGTVKIVNGQLPGDSRLYVKVKDINALDRLSGAEVDDRGHFTIRNLAAGTYLVTPNLLVSCDMKPVGPPQQVVVTDAATVNVTLTGTLVKGRRQVGLSVSSLPITNAHPKRRNGVGRQQLQTRRPELRCSRRVS